MPSSASPSPALTLLTATVLAWLAACSSGKPSDTTETTNPGRGVYVPVAWQVARTVSGHRIHVGTRHIECTKCHEMTATTVGRVKPSRCAACHEKEARLSHAVAQAREKYGSDATTDCTTCHAFAPSQRIDELPPPTPSGAPASPDAASTIGEADGGLTHAPPPDCLRCHRTAQGHVPAIGTHAKAPCVSCHRPHEDAIPKPAPCLSCHKDVSAEHAAHGGEAGCKGCHTHQHATAAEAKDSCTTCHASHQPIIPASALFANGHKACEDCHHPHDFQKALVAPCRSCHQAVHVLGETRAPAHRVCTSCHSPHDVRGSPRASCAGCHSTLHPDHPKLAGLPGNAGACVGCHDPHPAPGASHGLAKPCSTCHKAASADSAFHHDTACVQCHKPHDFVPDDTKALCTTCHAAKVAAVAKNPGHQTCGGCHQGLPHHPGLGAGACGACHAKERAAANPGHAACTNCHEPHAGSLEKTCNNCHAAEASTAPSGHQACRNCHEQHSGKPEHAVCANCHAKEAATRHGQITANCSSCHQPHGPAGPAAPPPCATCHAPAKLPGLHQAGKHTDCRNCHTGHDDPTAAMRAPCLSCHADRKNHFPDAPRCASCHIFGGH